MKTTPPTASPRLLALLGLLCLLLAACSFDTSALESKRECAGDDDCGAGERCLDNACVATGDTSEDQGDSGRLDLDDDAPRDSGTDQGDPDLSDFGGDGGPDADAGSACPGEENACGGCDTLANDPGDTCGSACGRGEWVCATANSVRCNASEGTPNACGGCEELEGDPGDTCGECGELQCDETNEAVECSDPGFNACGACGELGIEAEPGDPCGVCADGTLACNDEDQLVCQGATALNACGSCGPLSAAPGVACGVCADGEFVCNGEGTDVVCEGATPPNACGGCGTLVGAPGDECGDCGGGVWTCSPDDTQVLCDDPDPVNDCGGCTPLESAPDDSCGFCDDGTYVCALDSESLTCEGASSANACGSCGELEGVPGDSCGTCNDGTWVCGVDDVTCEGASTFNLCGACGVLAGAPDTACGTCGGGLWQCSEDGTAVTCEGDPGFNACGGCATLPGVPEAICTCAGAGEARWFCDGTETLGCEDDNDGFGQFTSLGTINENAPHVSREGVMDYAGDIEWYRLGATDVGGVIIQPEAQLTLPIATGRSFELCIFYDYTAIGSDILDYSCTSGACAYYDASEVRTQSGDCSNRPAGFDDGADLFGCCDTTFDGTRWRARLEDVDDTRNNSGLAYVRVRNTGTEAPDVCSAYTLTVGF